MLIFYHLITDRSITKSYFDLLPPSLCYNSATARSLIRNAYLSDTSSKSLKRQKKRVQHYAKFLSRLLEYTLISLACFSHCLSLQGQSSTLYFNELSYEISPHSTFGGTTNFFEDKEAFLWMMTEDGLYRYDGHELFEINSSSGDLNSLSSPRVKDMLQDKNGVFWISTSDGGLNAYDIKTGKFTHYRHDPDDKTSLSNDNLLFMAKDESDKLWIGSRFGINYFDPVTGHAIRYIPEPGVIGKLQGNPLSPFVVNPDRIYVSTTAGFEYYEIKTQRWHFFPVINEHGEFISHYVPGLLTTNSLCQDRNKKIWMGIPGKEGLRVYDPQSDQVSFFNVTSNDGHQNEFPNKILEDHIGRLWLCNSNNIWRISTDREKMEHCSISSGKTHQPITSGIITLNEDQYGLIWMGTYEKTFHFDPRQELIKYKHFAPITGQLNMDLHIDPNGIIWFTVERGLCKYNPQTNEFQFFDVAKMVTKLEPAGNNRLLMCGKDGVTIYYKDSGRSLLVKFNQRITLNNVEALGAAFDQDGDLWITTWGDGLFRIKNGHLDEATGFVKDFEQWLYKADDPKSIQGNYLHQVIIDSKNNVWVCGATIGLSRVDKKTGDVESFRYVQGDPNSISDNYTFGAVEDKYGDIWVTTMSKGLNKFSPLTRHFKKYNTSNGLPDDHLFRLVIDSEDKIWLSQNQKVFCFDPVTETTQTYGQNFRLAPFHSPIAIHPVTGDVYFVAKDELNYFSPRTIQNIPKKISPLRFSHIALFDPKKNAMRYLVDGQWENNKLALSHIENSIEFDFAVLDFRDPSKSEYQYSLTTSGADINWVNLGAKHSVSIAQMAPGSYVFTVKGKNSDGLWSELEHPLHFVILPPWWSSGWAWIIYVLIFLVALYSLNKFQLKRQFEKAESIRLSELDTLKTRLFTNITHEFRTPLTLILGPVRRLLNKSTQVTNDELKSNLSVVQDNGERLLALVNQILDLQKLEAHQLDANYESGDVMAFLRYIVNLFESIGESKGITLKFECEPSTLQMDYDKDKLLKIVTNLIANALKFTPEQTDGHVKVSVSEVSNKLQINVSDTGVGIAKEKLPYIFNLFYQADNATTRKGEGTGIGLTLVKELIELLSGTINVESPDPSTNSGSVFKVILPIVRNTKPKTSSQINSLPNTEYRLLNTEYQLPNIAHVSRLTSHEAELPLVLVVEDNAEVAHYIGDCLKDTYHVEYATNGKIGMARALELIPDLVISDVMMPEADGFEVCRFLKNDQRTSHIPVILLTALAGIQNRLEGLRRGADAYLAKPFYEEELQLTVEKLLQLRQSLLKRYAELKTPDAENVLADKTNDTILPDTPFDLQVEDAFIKKATDIVQLHLNDANFSVENLCREMGMSNTQLFRKMKALTNRSAVELIRDVRLGRAKELLLQSDLTVSEIAYETGFSDPAYFSRLFAREMGMSPSKYAAEK